MSSLKEHIVDFAEDIYEDTKKRWIVGIAAIVVTFLAVWLLSSNTESQKAHTIALLEQQQRMEDSISHLASLRADAEAITPRERNRIIEEAKADLRAEPKYAKLQTEINGATVKEPSVFRNIWDSALYAIAAALLVAIVMRVNSQLAYMKLAKENDYLKKTITNLTIIVWGIIFFGMIALHLFRPV